MGRNFKAVQCWGCGIHTVGDFLAKFILKMKSPFKKLPALPESAYNDGAKENLVDEKSNIKKKPSVGHCGACL